jgi:hypothetical protein
LGVFDPFPFVAPVEVDVVSNSTPVARKMRSMMSDFFDLAVGLSDIDEAIA